MSKKKAAKATVVTDHKNIDQLLIYANYVRKSIDAIFTCTDKPKILAHDDTVSMMLYEMALLYFKYDANGAVTCVVSIHDECDVILVAELMNCLKDIFKQNIYVNEDTYIQDPTGIDLIWGRDNIDNHNDRTWGIKVSHTVMFDDSMAGHG